MSLKTPLNIVLPTIFATFFLVLSLFPNMSDPYFAIGWTLTLLILFRAKQSPIQISIVDICVILFWLYELISFQCTTNYLSSFHLLKIYTISTLYYFMIRLYFREEQYIRVLLNSFIVIISLFAIFSTISFLNFSKSMHSVEIDNLYHFRAIFRPIGHDSNTWSYYLLGMVGISIISFILNLKEKKKVLFQIISLTLLLFGIVVSFSRGIYISIFLGIIVFIIGLIKTSLIQRKTKILISIVLVLFISTLSFLYKEEVIQTLKFHNTISQQLSTQSRIDMTKISLDASKEHLFLGTGSGTWLSSLNEYRFESDYQQITNIAPNIFSKILIEKGLVGLIIIAIIFSLIIFRYLKRIKDNKLNLIIITVLGCFLIRETTYSLIFSSMYIQLILVSILAIAEAINKPEKYTFNISKKLKKIVLVVPAVACVSITYFMTILSINKENNQKAIASINQLDIGKAIDYIEKTDELLPYLINRSNIYWKAYIETQNIKYLNLAYKNIVSAIDQEPNQPMLQHNLAYIEYARGNTKNAITNLGNLVHKFPDNTLYNYSLFYLSYKYNQQNIEHVIPNIVHAIMLSPEVMETSLWKKEIMNSSSLINNIKKTIYEKISDNEFNPFSLAKNGKILYVLGDKKAAEESISKALSLMPNLSLAWFNLARIELDKGGKNKADLFLERARVLSNIPERVIESSQFSKYETLNNIFSNKDGTFNFVSSKFSVKFINSYRVDYYAFNI